MNIQEIRQQYPQYKDMSDGDLAQALHGKYYSDMPYEQFAAKVGVEIPRERTMGESLTRQLGLTARAGIGGIGALANAVADPVVGGLNAVLRAAQPGKVSDLVTGKQPYQLPIPSQALERTMTRMGLPQPQGGLEEFAQTTARGMVAPGAVAKVLPQFAANLGMQTVAAGMGAGASDLARQGGAGPLGQFAAGVAGGIVPATAGAAALEAAKVARSGAPALMEPLTSEGRRRIAARAVQGAASDKDAAAQAAQGAPEYVPGSMPTMGEATGDMGLGLMEKAIRNRHPEAFAARAAEQDAARQAGLAKSFGTATDITMAEQHRDQVTKAMREAAFAGAKTVNTKPIITAANSIMKSGPGGRQEVTKAMEWVRARVDEIGNDPERVYSLRQDINDIIAGKMRDPEKASFQLAAGQLKAVKAVLDQQLEKSAPGFKAYLQTYSGMTREIEKAALGQEIAAKSLNPTTERLSTPQFTREFEKRSEDIAKSGAVASDALTRVAMDMRRSAAPLAAGKTPGSDTLQNLVANNFLQRAGINANGPAQTAMTKATGLLYKPFGVEEATQQIMRDAFLDPKGKGAGLLKMELKRNPLLMTEILERLRAAPYGGLLGAGVSSK